MGIIASVQPKINLALLFYKKKKFSRRSTLTALYCQLRRSLGTTAAPVKQLVIQIHLSLLVGVQRKPTTNPLKKTGLNNFCANVCMYAVDGIKGFSFKHRDNTVISSA